MAKVMGKASFINVADKPWRYTVLCTEDAIGEKHMPTLRSMTSEI